MLLKTLNFLWKNACEEIRTSFTSQRINIIMLCALRDEMEKKHPDYCYVQIKPFFFAPPIALSGS